MKKALLILIALLCMGAQGAWAQTTYKYYECSWDEVNKQVVRTERTASGNIDDISSAKYAKGGGLIGKQANGSGYDYFVLTKSCKIQNGLTVSGHCKLILLDGVEVTIGTTTTGINREAFDGQGHGIEVPEGSTLEIYAQSTGNSKGKLIAKPHEYTAEGNAGIGSKKGKNPGKIRIHGGYIESYGECKAASIGGGEGGRGADIIIYDGVVKACNYDHQNQAAGDGPEGGGNPLGEVGIGAGHLSGDAGTIVIYGGNVYAEGGPQAAGIGCSRGPEVHSSDPSSKERSTCSGSVTIHGGTVTAEGGWTGAGIGCGLWAKGITVTINGGTVKAQGGLKGAGIGGGLQSHGGTVIINGGTVVAKGGKYGAGIGGGQDGNGANVTVNGGHVDAYGGVDAAGIGTGEEYSYSDIHGGKLTVTGGYVFADGTDWGAGIGGGEDAKGADVTITGGTVIAWAGADAGKKNGSAIGSEDGDGRRGTLHIGDKMMVHAGQSEGASNYKLFSTGERVPACFFRPYCRVEVCTHQGGIYEINGTGAEDTHTLRCTHCSYRTPEKHDFSKGAVCPVCGAKGTTLAVTVYLPDLSGTDGSYKVADTFTFAALKNFKLPEPPKEFEPEGMEFAGWLLKGPDGLTSWSAQTSESLQSALSECYLGSNLSLTARYRMTDVTLYGAENNEETLEKYKDRKVNSVTLSGRTLLKDGSWNTICLPFDVTLADSPLKGDGVEVRTLESSTFSDGVLTLNFSEPQAQMEAGKPYIIKWTSGDNLVNPKFGNVTINKTKKSIETVYADFAGTYAPVETADNRLFESDNASKGTCRAFLDIKADTQREDYTFHGWNTEADGSGTEVTTVIPFGTNGTFAIYAQWEENAYDISLKDAGDNSTVFEQRVGKKVNVTYDRVLAATDKGNGEWESRAFTVCLPYALNLTAQQEAGQVEVYQPQLIKDNNKLMFTNASPQLEAGSPYVIVVNSGELSLNAHGVRLVDEPKQGCDIYNYDGSTNLLGVFKGTFKKIESADAAAQFAYSFQKDGYFKRIRPDTPNAYWGAFRAMFCAAAPAGQDPAVSPLGTNWFKAMYQKWLNGDEDESNPITGFPADSFEGDSDISDGTGIMHVINKDGKHLYFDLQGRRLQNPPAKGIYIDNGKQVIK